MIERNTKSRHLASPYQPGVNIADLQLITKNTHSTVWNVLRGKSIFITGGTGFVGCWLLEALIWANLEMDLGLNITVLTRDPIGFAKRVPHLANNLITEIHVGEVTKLEHIDGSYDIIIHAAADATNRKQNRFTEFENMVCGTMQTLKLGKRCSASHYIFISSGAVYGKQPANLSHIAENYHEPSDVNYSYSSYAYGKRVSEWMVQNYPFNNQIKTKIARCFSFIGPYLPLNKHYAIGNFIRDQLKGKPIRVESDGSSIRSYLYAADMVIWLLTILCKGKSGHYYNVGSELELTISDLAYKILSFDPASKVDIIGKPIPGLGSQRYVPHTGKAQHQLKLKEFTDLNTAIAKTMEWATNNLEYRKSESNESSQV